MCTTAARDPGGPEFGDTASDSERMWATGPLDTAWHRVQQSRFGSLLCACGRYVVGPVHLRRYRPADGELGRTLCPALTAPAHQRDGDTDRWYLRELAIDETAGRTEPALIRPPHHDDTAPPARPRNHAA